MTIVRAVGVAGFVIASFIAGCGGDRTDPGGGGPSPPPPQVIFLTADRTTSAHVAAIRIINATGEVPADVIDAVSSNIRVATWPANVEVTSTETILTGAAATLPNTVTPAGAVEIDRQLDPGFDQSAWYAISLPASSAYTSPAGAFAFDTGVRGSRFSPAHAPVVASIMSCPKDGGVVAVYVSYSERVVRTAGTMPALDYGATAVSCTIGGDSTTETQFICSGTDGGQPFSLRIPDGVTAQDSGAAMAPASIDSAGMQTTVTSDGCTIHMPVNTD